MGRPARAAAASLRDGNLGYEPLPGAITRFGDTPHYRDFLGSEVGAYEGHPYYRHWQPDGFKLAVLRERPCDAAAAGAPLGSCVSPPWAPITAIHREPDLRSRESNFRRTLDALAAACGLEFMPIEHVDGLEIGHFSDETHLNPEGASIFDAELLRRLGYSAKRPGGPF